MGVLGIMHACVCVCACTTTTLCVYMYTALDKYTWCIHCALATPHLHKEGFGFQQHISVDPCHLSRKVLCRHIKLLHLELMHAFSIEYIHPVYIVFVCNFCNIPLPQHSQSSVPPSVTTHLARQVDCSEHDHCRVLIKQASCCVKPFDIHHCSGGYFSWKVWQCCCTYFLGLVLVVCTKEAFFFQCDEVV